MTEQEYIETFKGMPKEELARVAVLLAMDSDRLRAELDESKGVIR